MLKVKLFYFILFFVLFSCSSDKTPEDLLSQDQMRDVLIQLHLAEGKTTALNLAPDSGYGYYKIYEAQALKKTGTTRQQFDQSYQYYMQHIKLMDKIYAEVIDSLSLKESLKKID